MIIEGNGLTDCKTEAEVRKFISANFQTSFSQDDEIKEIIFAEYDCPAYEGNWTSLHVGTDGKLYYVTAGHCSCYGLEDKWDPEHVQTKYTLSVYLGAHRDEKVAKSLLNYCAFYVD